MLYTVDSITQILFSVQTFKLTKNIIQPFTFLFERNPVNIDIVTLSTFVIEHTFEKPG